MRRMKAVIHGRSKPQRDVSAVAVRADEPRIADQLLQRVGKPLDLEQFGTGDWPGRTDDRIARANQDLRIAVDRPRAILELADEAVVHAAEFSLFGLAQVE